MSTTAAPPVASLIPHAGRMCLLDRVLEWDDERILCEASVSDVHPLNTGGRLPSTALIEYAAQAMAAHGRLLALARLADENSGDENSSDENRADENSGDENSSDEDGAGDGKPTPGMLIGLRATDLSCRWVSHQRLAIEVRRLGGDEANILYGFEVSGTAAPGVDTTASGPGETLASGRAFVTLERPR